MLDTLKTLSQIIQPLSDNISGLLGPIVAGMLTLRSVPLAPALLYLLPGELLYVYPALAFELGRFFDALNRLSDHLSTANGALGEMLNGPTTCVAAGVRSNDRQSGPDILRGSHSVKVDIDLLHNLMAYCSNAAEDVDTQVGHISSISLENHELGNLQDALALLNGVPIVGGAATNLRETLSEAHGHLDTYFGCYSAGLYIMADGLLKAEKLFQNVDHNLSVTIAEIHSLM